MKKIPTLFQRNYETDRLVRNEVTPGTEWVLKGEGVATRKYDGTCCMIRDGKLYKRYEVKPGGKPPLDFEPANDTDPETGKQQGWVPVGDGPDDRWHLEAFAKGYCLANCYDLSDQGQLIDGTYELCGPKINGNPDQFLGHFLVAHGMDVVEGCPRDFEGLRSYLRTHCMEGIVFHHPDGRMAKIKKRDFGFKR